MDETTPDKLTGDAFLAKVKELYANPDFPESELLTDQLAAFEAGELEQDEFEYLFDSAFRESVEVKNEARRKKLQFYMALGLRTENEFESVHSLNSRIHEGMDLTNHYVELIREKIKDHTGYIREGKVVEAHVHKRKCYPDGTPRAVIQDLNSVELIQYKQFIDLIAYHDDGDMNVELTAAMHEARAERHFQRQQNKLIRRIPVGISNPTGRNEPCPCGSGKKYKKCHLLELGDAVVGISLEEAQRRYGKDAFDIKAPADSLEEATV